MDIRGWNERYLSKERAGEDFDAEPASLVFDTVTRLEPGGALDLACGTGRNALWLAARGWSVTAVDGAPAAIEVLRSRAIKSGLHIEAKVADLQRHEFQIEPSTWDLILVCYYLQRDLLEAAKNGVRPGGILLVIVHIPEEGEQPTATRMRPGELRTYFEDWEILHEHEGKSRDSAHRRPVAEIVARKP